MKKAFLFVLLSEVLCNISAADAKYPENMRKNKAVILKSLICM